MLIKILFEKIYFLCQVGGGCGERLDRLELFSRGYFAF